jgi:putative membrane protein
MGNTRMQLRGLMACGLVAMTAACASSGSMAAGADMNGMNGSASGSMMMTDANVAAVAHASNMDEIQTSQLALQRSQNAQVRQFAQMMITEHTAVDQQMMQMLQAKGMTMQPNQPAQAAMQATQATLANLSRATGAAFDRAYMMHQVASHRWTLASLDQSLIPSTRDDQMKAFLTTRVRPAVAMHLETAMRLNTSVGGSNSASMDHSGMNHSGMNHSGSTTTTTGTRTP